MKKARKKAAKPKPDFAQSALASLLKATGVKSLVEPKVVPLPRQKTEKIPSA